MGDRFVDKLLFLLPTLSGPFIAMALQTLLSQADIRGALYLELRDKQFHSLVSHRSVCPHDSSEVTLFPVGTAMFVWLV